MTLTEPGQRSLSTPGQRDELLKLAKRARADWDTLDEVFRKAGKPAKLDDEWRRLQERVRRTLSVVLELLDLELPMSAEAVEVLYGACSNIGPSPDATSKAAVAQSVRTADSVLSQEIGELLLTPDDGAGTPGLARSPHLVAGEEITLQRRLAALHDAVSVLAMKDRLDRAEEASAQVEDARESIEGVTNRVRELVGEAASQSLADQYLTSSRREALAAEVLRGLAVVVVLVAAVIAFRVPLDAARLPDLEHHLSYAVPVAVLAAYLARESAHHRFVSRELSFVGMRLAALMSFADALAGQDREVFLRDVGTLLFTQPANKPGRREVQGLPSDQMDALLARIADLVHGQGRDPVDKPRSRRP